MIWLSSVAYMQMKGVSSVEARVCVGGYPAGLSTVICVWNTVCTLSAERTHVCLTSLLLLVLTCAWSWSQLHRGTTFHSTLGCFPQLPCALEYKMQLGTSLRFDNSSHLGIPGCPFVNPKDCPFYKADGLPHVHTAADFKPVVAAEPVFAPVVCQL